MFWFEGLKPGVTIARRGQTAYGGLNMRFSPREQQQIVEHTDPPDAEPRRCWAQLTGVPPEGEKPICITILQRKENPDYPGDWVKYPNLNWLQPTFPASGTAYELKPDKPLILRYRLLISKGALPEAEAAAAWDAYHQTKDSR